MEQKNETYTQQFNRLNKFLVEVFNDILKLEANSLRKGEFKNLSMKEIHIIEAVCTANAVNNALKNHSADIAEMLDITAGTLTVAVNTLVKKGYITRERNLQDKRIVHLLPTEKALAVNELHSKFHSQMVESVLQELSQEQIDILCDNLAILHTFLRNDN